MNFVVAYHTDIGISKHTNQDSLAIKMMDTSRGRATLAIVCDGMGGLSKGELASKEVIRSYCDWFDVAFAKGAMNDNFNMDQMLVDWRNIAIENNRRLSEYGNSHDVMLGTTLSAILFLEDNFYIVHVGDSRIYQLHNQEVTQLTTDQTVIAREIARGNLTEEQAKRDARRNVLLQCVGASKYVEPELIQGKICPGAVYLLCSDGFRHEITNEEIYQRLNGEEHTTSLEFRNGLVELTELVKTRQERDNITAIVLKSC